jgi:hypothetical protein
MNGVLVYVKVTSQDVYAYCSKPFTQSFGMLMHFIVIFPRLKALIFSLSRTEKSEKKGVVLQIWATEKLETEEKRLLF